MLFFKEIVFGRIDILNKLWSNCILPPRKIFEGKDQGDKNKENDVDVGTDINGNLAMTTAMKGRITAKITGHLSPVPLQTNPIYWQYDHSAQLYPLPDILVLSESTTKCYSQNYENDVKVINPCLFYVDYKFLVLKPRC
jgi:hypothetical protein